MTTLDRSLMALRLELPESVANSHEAIVRAEIGRLTTVLARIANGATGLINRDDEMAEWAAESLSATN
jgi:hypothetical protein